MQTQRKHPSVKLISTGVLPRPRAVGTLAQFIIRAVRPSCRQIDDR